MEKYQNKYRIASARAEWWNYDWAGAYFITICTHEMKHYFGTIENGKMLLSPTGILADVFWYQIPQHNENIELGSFVIMPNHMHGILILREDAVQTLQSSKEVETLQCNISTIQSMGEVRTLHCNVPTNKKMAEISPKSGTVSAIIRSYKSAVTKHANRLGFEFKWQERFYDHIIRDDEAYQRINDYIETNPLNWEKDKFAKHGIL